MIVTQHISICIWKVQWFCISSPYLHLLDVIRAAGGQLPGPVMERVLHENGLEGRSGTVWGGFHYRNVIVLIIIHTIDLGRPQ